MILEAYKDLSCLRHRRLQCLLPLGNMCLLRRCQRLPRTLLLFNGVLEALQLTFVLLKCRKILSEAIFQIPDIIRHRWLTLLSHSGWYADWHCPHSLKNCWRNSDLSIPLLCSRLLSLPSFLWMRLPLTVGP